MPRLHSGYLQAYTVSLAGLMVCLMVGLVRLWLPYGWLMAGMGRPRLMHCVRLIRYL
ncbi:hypothetical protein [Pantoea phage Nifs112]|nr:hypothetical protein [Pantoea phage Nifs112]